MSSASHQTFTSYHSEPIASLPNIAEQEFKNIPLWHVLQEQYGVVAGAPPVPKGVIIPEVLAGKTFSSYSPGMNNASVER